MEEFISRAFLRRLTSTPEGRAHLLNIAVEAEEGDEGGIFDQLCTQVGDPELETLVRRHRDDEMRHAGMFRACLERTGVRPRPVPDRLRLIRRIAEQTGGFERGVKSRVDVMRTYALLLAIEERGVEQFPRIAAAFLPDDPETAAVYLAVTKDEERHVKYCRAIGPRYAPDAATWERALCEARATERTAFHRVGVANLIYSFEQGLLRLGPLSHLARLGRIIS